MDSALDATHVAEKLPNLGNALEDPRLRPAGLGGGAIVLTSGAVLSIAPTSGQVAFWSNAVAATLVFVSVSLFCLGLAAVEPPASSRFHFGVDLGRKQRHAVAAGSLCILISPLVVTVGSALGLSVLVLTTGATMTFVGASLVLTGFLAWTSEAIGSPRSA